MHQAKGLRGSSHWGMKKPEEYEILEAKGRSYFKGKSTTQHIKCYANANENQSWNLSSVFSNEEGIGGHCKSSVVAAEEVKSISGMDSKQERT